MRQLAPLAVIAWFLPLVIAATVATHPAILLVLVAAGFALLAVAPGGARVSTALAGSLGVMMVLVTPLSMADGDLILVDGPNVGVLDLQITAEELLAGLASAARIVATVTLVTAAIRLVDADRAEARLARVAPSSTLAVALAGRLLPLLAADGRALLESAEIRGVATTARPVRTAIRNGATLAVPFVATGVERALDQAELLAVRGIGSGPATHSLERPLTAPERALAGLGAVAATIVAAMIATGAYRHTYLPRIEPPSSIGVVYGAALVLVTVAAVALVRGARRG